MTTDPEHLRPLERRVLAMRQEGMSIEEIAHRFQHSPDHVLRILRWTKIPRGGPPRKLTPPAVERRVVAMRVAGDSYENIADRFRRRPGSIRQIEGLTYFVRGTRQKVFDRGRELLRQNAEEARLRHRAVAEASKTQHKEATDD